MSPAFQAAGRSPGADIETGACRDAAVSAGRAVSSRSCARTATWED